MAASPSHGASTRLPSGECSYRDLGLGTAAPSCGCNRFWVDESRPKPVSEGTVQDGSDTIQTPWCICGHHACFHKESRRSIAEALGIEKANRASSGQAQSMTQDSDAVFVQYVRHTQDGRMQLVTGSPLMIPKKPTMAAPGIQRINTSSTVQEPPLQPTTSQRSGQFSQPAQQSRNTASTQIFSNLPQTRRFSSPRLPAIQRLEGSRPSSAGSQYRRTSSPQDRRQELSSDGQKQGNAGLGLNFTLPAVAPSLPSTTNSVQTGELPEWARMLKEYNERPVSVAPSAIGEVHRTSPDSAFLQRASQQRCQYRGPLLPPVTTGFTFANDKIGEELSATEIATPSNRGTPDLHAFENIFHEVGEAVDRHTGSTAVESSGRQRSPPSNAASSSLQRLLPHLNAIRDYMASRPHESVRQRLDALENMSFNQTPIDELQEKSELLEAHLIDVLNKLEDQGNRLNIMQGERGGKRRRLLSIGNEAANTSFTSNSSVQSTTSSALIAAAIERQETETKIRDVEERLSQLESTAMPSFAHPLEVEVVLLPWGRDLKGIWFSPDNAPAQSSVFTTQESDAWTQAVDSSQKGHSLHQSGHSGWSSDDIHGWADSTDEWLCARACSSNGVVYQRLRSRGFVKSIELRRSGAREFQSTLKNAFLGLSQYFPVIEAEETSQSLGDASPSTSFLGLRRPFIPLRKIHKSSRLRFLNTSEMLTPAVWTAEFLLSSVIMRGQGGQKRLFITNPDAYLQHNDRKDFGWTWQKLRELPRITSSEAQSDSGVGEADAKEACWNYHPSYDPPQSVASSFSSIVSTHLSRTSVRGTPPPTSQQQSHLCLEQNAQDPAQGGSESGEAGRSSQARRRYPPITPLSNITPRHRRTASAPISEHSSAAVLSPPMPRKRRFISFDGAPHPRGAMQISRRTSALSVQSGSSLKRQRISRSPEMERSVAAQGFTPRRSKEPPSPFYPPSSQGVPVSKSQGRAVGDQAAAGASITRGSWETAAAYATPYSGGQMLQYEAMTATDIDTEIGSGMVEDQEEVWEGVTEAEEPGHEELKIGTLDNLQTIELPSEKQNNRDFDSENDSNIENVDDDEDEEVDDTGDIDAVFDGHQFGY